MRSKALSVCLVLPSLAPGRPQVGLDASTLLDTLLKAEQLQILSFLQSWDWADHGQRWEPEEHTKPGKRAKFDVTVSRYLAVSYHFSTLLMRRSPEWLGPLIAPGQENKLRGVGSLGSLIHQHLGGESERAGTSTTWRIDFIVHDVYSYTVCTTCQCEFPAGEWCTCQRPDHLQSGCGEVVAVPILQLLSKLISYVSYIILQQEEEIIGTDYEISRAHVCGIVGSRAKKTIVLKDRFLTIRCSMHCLQISVFLWHTLHLPNCLSEDEKECHGNQENCIDSSHD